MVSGVATVCAVVAGLYLALAVVAAVVRGEIRHSVEIDAPVDAVWSYGSDSTAAREWSVFFHHITPIEAEGRPPDGTVGAFRVCHRTADEHGMAWDETTEEITPERHRRIRTFNLVNFPFGWFGRAQEYEVHQDYEALDADRTRLTFRSSIVRRPGVLDRLAWPISKTVYAMLGAPAGQTVFVWNLENIRAAVEARCSGEPYERPHPYAPELPWESRPARWWITDRMRVLCGLPVPPGPRPHVRPASPREGARGPATR